MEVTVVECYWETKTTFKDIEVSQPFIWDGVLYLKVFNVYNRLGSNFGNACKIYNPTHEQVFYKFEDNDEVIPVTKLSVNE